MPLLRNVNRDVSSDINRPIWRRVVAVGGGGGGSEEGGGAAPFNDEHSILFDGYSENITVPHHADFDFEYDTPFSLSAWSKTTDWGSQGMIGKMNNGAGSATNGWAMGTSTGTFYFFLVNTWTSPSTGGYVSGFINDGVWRNFIVTYDGTSVVSGFKMYTNGVSGTVSNYPSNTLALNSMKNTDPIQLGSWWGDSTQYGWNGNLNDVAVWDRVLTGAEATEIYNSGDPDDLLQHSASSSLVAYWTFDEAADDATGGTGVITDRTGNGHDGTPTNTEAEDIEEDVP